MSSFPRLTNNSIDAFTLYPESGQTLDKKQIAEVIGVSCIRAAQIVGTKSHPNPDFGTPQKIEGVRGMRWPSEDVYKYTLRSSRDARNVPPLVPHPDKARYTLDEGRSKVYDETMILVFNEQIETSDPYTIYLGWPLKSGSLNVQELRDSCISSPDLSAQATDRNIFISFWLPSPGASDAYMVSEYTLGSLKDQWRSTASLRDFYPSLLACINLEYLPVWREGDMSADDARQWINQGCNTPLQLPCPEPVRDLYALYKYALSQAKEETDKILAGSWSVMATFVEAGTLGKRRSGYTTEYLKGAPQTFRWALQFTPLETPPAAPHPSPGFYLALDKLAEASNLTTLAQTALNIIGDHRYQKPETFSLEKLPDTWRKDIKQLAEANLDQLPDAYTARFQRLIATHFNKAGGSAIPQSSHSNSGYLLITDTHYTTMPSLGYSNPQTTTPKDLQRLWPEDAQEVLVQRNEQGQLAAWVRTTEGIRPLPTSYPAAPHPTSAFAALTTPPGHDDELMSRVISPNSSAVEIISRIPAGEYRVFGAQIFVATFA